MKVGSLKVEYTAATAKFEAAGRRVKRELSAQGKAVKALRRRYYRLRKSIKQNIFSMKGLKTAAITLAGGGALGLLIQRVTESAAQLEILSNRVGISTKDITVLGRVFEREGANVELTADALGELSKRLGEASLGVGEALIGLKAIGVSFREINGLPLPEQIALIADRIAALDDQQTEMLAADKFFGGQGKVLLGTLRKGGDHISRMATEMEKIGYLTDAQAKKFADLRQKQRGAGDAVETLTQKLALSQADESIDFLERFTNWVVRLGNMVDGTSDKTDAFNKSLIKQSEVVNLVVDQYEGLNEATKLRVKEAERLIKEYENMEASFAGFKAELGAAFAIDFPNKFADGMLRVIEGTEKASDALRGMLKEIVKIAIRSAILEPIGQSLGGSISKFLGIGGKPAPGRAVGGMVSARNSYIVGERGPERFIPNVGGRIVAGRGGDTNSTTIIIEGGVSEQFVMDQLHHLAANIPNAVKNVVRAEEGNRSQGFRSR